MSKEKNSTAQKDIELLVERILDGIKEISAKKLAYTVEEAAFSLGVSEYFVYELIKQNEITPIVRLGRRGIRVPVKSLEAFVERGGVTDKAING